MTRRINATEFAEKLGYPNVEAFEAARSEGLIPSPDGVLDKSVYWWPETVQTTVTAHTNAIRSAWGHAPIKDDDGEIA